jgi:hypothetical protein
MAFGFPAHHTETYSSVLPLEQERKHILAAATGLKWKLREKSEYENTLTFSTRVSWSSWGEVITIRFSAHPDMSIESKCSAATQCWDWGKNRKNAQNLTDRLNQLEAPIGW